ncbi:MAPEG family protein [Parahaliea aestuarii]|uniref:MAPEG family protein n=1 Tax=Parahaliea aestuarii TaxID=1852021 RepID=A0A5C8ZRJ4_9GAMM|nr:MAPEG family protein [Parahaliea aestuarii]TXS90349.1 MAPEG family protein [Parahaliea aestuarii]
MFTETYQLTILAFGLTGLLLLIQMLVADFAGMGAKHTPGHPVPADHGSFFFRAVRAQANTNESIAVFILLALFGMLGGAAPAALGWSAMVYVAGRAGHMVFYYAGIGLARSICFGIALLGLAAMAVIGFMAL